jgi:hypothetical protein
LRRARQQASPPHLSLTKFGHTETGPSLFCWLISNWQLLNRTF